MFSNSIKVSAIRYDEEDADFKVTDRLSKGQIHGRNNI